jgi:hypothetical protein
MDDLVQLRRETVAAAEAAYGGEHINTIQALVDLARQYKVAGAQAQAEEAIDEVVRRFTAQHGAEHDATRRAVLLAEQIKAPQPQQPQPQQPQPQQPQPQQPQQKSE